MPPDYSQQPQFQQPAQTPSSSYDFILSPQQAPKKPLFSNSSLLLRIVFASGGLLMLLILFVAIKSLVAGGPDYSGYMVVAEDQQAILHTLNNVSGSSSSSQNLSPSAQNLAATASLSLSSNQMQVFTYLKGNGQKIDPKKLNLKVNTQFDTQLSNAQTAGTYGQAFTSILGNELSAYKNDLSTTYKSNTGPKGRALLKSLYAQAALLQNQLASGN